MRLRYFSDLHLEFLKLNEVETFIKKISINKDDVCILAGDIGNPFQENYDIFMKFINTNFKKTFVITGNHEYYNKTKTINEINEHLNNYFKQYTNISFLNNNFEYYENYCFIGTTLWSKITNFNNKINDVYNIKDFDCKKYNNLNIQCVDFLKKTLNNNSNCIVITHHLPSYSLIDEKYKTQSMDPYNQWFYCDLYNLITLNKDKIKCWFYGHTHTKSIKMIHDIYFLCNPIGYPNENDDINFDLNIEFKT